MSGSGHPTSARPGMPELDDVLATRGVPHTADCAAAAVGAGAGDTAAAVGGEASPPSLAVRSWIVIVQLYRAGFAQFFGGACRFYPSCSEYSVMAVRRHGLGRGLWLTLGRILRCQPFSPGGLDFP